MNSETGVPSNSPGSGAAVCMAGEAIFDDDDQVADLELGVNDRPAGTGVRIRSVAPNTLA